MLKEEQRLRDIELQPIKEGELLETKQMNNAIHHHDTHPPKSRIIAVVAFYIVTSITMIMVNKAVLRRCSAAPMTFLWGQLVTAVFVLQVVARRPFQILQLPPIDRETVSSLKFLIGMNVVGLALNTLCLRHIDAALYQVARSLILPLTVLLGRWLAPGQPWPTGKILLACSIIFAGFTIGVGLEGRVQVSAVGVAFGVASSAATAIHSYVIKQSFGRVPHNGAFDMVYYNNLLSAIALFPIVLLELPTLLAEDADTLTALLYGTVIAGATGLLINLAGFLQIRTTSPLTHTVSSAARGVLQTVACYVFLNEPITPARLAGITVTLAGSALYSYFKAAESPNQQEYKAVPQK